MSSYISTQSSSVYKEALTAVENLESPALGFVKPAEYKSSVQLAISAVIKQNNTLIQLLATLSEKVEKLEERLQRLEARKAPEVSPLPADLIERLQNLEVSDKPPRRTTEPRGKLRVFTDPLTILKEEQAKAKFSK